MKEVILKYCGVLLLFLVGFVYSGNAQSLPSGSAGIVYTYDAVGNRIDRKYIVNNTAETVESKLSKDSVQVKSVQKNNLIKVNALYPNPTTGKITVSLMKPVNNASVEIFDASGRLIFRSHQSGGILRFNLGQYSDGIYFLHLSDNGNFVNLKVIKK